MIRAYWVRTRSKVDFSTAKVIVRIQRRRRRSVRFVDQVLDEMAKRRVKRKPGGELSRTPEPSASTWKTDPFLPAGGFDPGGRQPGRPGRIDDGDKKDSRGGSSPARRARPDDGDLGWSSQAAHSTAMVACDRVPGRRESGRLRSGARRLEWSWSLLFSSGGMARG